MPIDFLKMNESTPVVNQPAPVECERWHLNIDKPEQRGNIPKHVRIHGWIFDKQGVPIKAVRAIVNGRTYSGKYGISRPDVRGIYSEYTEASCCGFYVPVTLSEKRNNITLEALLGCDAALDAWIPFQHLEFKRANLFRRVITALDLGFWIQFRRNPWKMWQQLNARRRLMVEGLIEHHSPVRLESLVQHEPKPLLEKKSVPPYDGESRFAIVTPSYNQAKYLRQTIDSILSQEAPRLAYVIQDGGSNDGSVEVIREYGEKLASWVSEKDEGQSDAIVKGFAKVAPGDHDIMAYINSDDVYMPGTFKIVGDYFDANPDVDVVYGHRIIIDEKGDEIGRWHMPPHDDSLLSLVDYIPQETLFWRRSAYKRAGGVDKGFRFAMDWDLLLKFRKAGCRMVRLPFYLAAFRVHGDQKTSTIINSVGVEESRMLRERECGGEVDLRTILEAVRCMTLSATLDEWISAPFRQRKN
jgi:GT2 family glycosyltransferase